MRILPLVLLLPACADLGEEARSFSSRTEELYCGWTQLNTQELAPLEPGVCYLFTPQSADVASTPLGATSCEVVSEPRQYVSGRVVFWVRNGSGVGLFVDSIEECDAL